MLSGWTTREAQNEKFVFMEKIYSEDPGSLVITRDLLGAGESDKLVNAFTGADTYTVEGGRDMIVKQMWVTTDQPVRMLVEEINVVHDEICKTFIPSFEKPINVLDLGYTKGTFLDLDKKMEVKATIKNYGNEPMEGKIWAMFVEKDGAYEFR